MKRLASTGLLSMLLLTTGAQALEARAVIKTPQRAILSAELVAKVIDLPKSPGEAFQKGDLLVQLDCRLFEAQTDKVQAEQRASQLKLQNAQTLNRLNAIGQLEVDMAQAELDKVQAELRMTQLNVERCQIHAPYDGKVVQWLVKPYEIANQNQTLIEIVGTQQLEAEMIVPAYWVNWLKLGKSVNLKIEELNQVIPTRITHIGAVIDPVSQTLVLRSLITKPPAGLLPGMSVTAEFEPPKPNAITP